ncbi:MAG: hypothetical protein IJ309_02385 [Clostridia bacterium]|nr:hypothetical protein [Clostridia bacterium]
MNLTCKHCSKFAQCFDVVKERGKLFDASYLKALECPGFDNVLLRYSTLIFYKVELVPGEHAEYMLSIDVPKSVAQDLEKGYIPVQIENIIQNIVLVQGFEKAEILSAAVGDAPLDEPFDVAVIPDPGDNAYLLNEALKALAHLSSLQIKEAKPSIEKLNTIIKSLKEVEDYE